jgi:single-stranded DNA-binding protein
MTAQGAEASRPSALQAAPTPCAVTAALAFRPLLRGVANATPAGLIPRDHKEDHHGPRILRTHRQCRQTRDQANQGRQEARHRLPRNVRTLESRVGDWNEKTYWHRVAVFAPAKVALIEKAVQVGTRLRLVGQIRPGSWEDERGQTRYSIEFVVTGFGDVEILARGKPKADAQSEPVIVGEEAPKPKRKRAA